MYILDYKRSPFGCFNGALSGLSIDELCCPVIDSLLSKNARIVPDLFILGQAVPAGSGQNPSALVMNKLCLNTVPSFSVNKVCASGMEAVMLACDVLSCNMRRTKFVLAGGVEQMSKCPHYLMNQRSQGCKFGDLPLKDGLLFDGLTDSATNMKMGECGDMLAREYNIERPIQDQWAVKSFTFGLKAYEDRLYEREVVPVNGLTRDEQLQKFNPQKMATLKPSFSPTGTITAANSSPLSDGAAFLLLSSEPGVEGGALAKIIGYADAQVEDPRRFPTAIIPAVEKALLISGIGAQNVDHWEISEAFALVPEIVSKHFDIPQERVNEKGGAVGLGHPLGASGARMVGTLAMTLKLNVNSKYGVAAICNGGGGASAIVLERV